jgi:NAD(P)H dehydrogenase (quinone)
MNNFLVLAHPDEQSLQSSLFHEVEAFLRQKGEKVVCTDLYGSDFPPLLNQEEIIRGSSTEIAIVEQQRNLADCKRLFLFYPDWWGMPPAILKGWLDRILASETAFSWEGEDFLEKSWVSLLEGREAVVFISGDGALDREWLKQLWDKQIFGKCGMTVRLRVIDKLRQRNHGEIRRWIEDQIESL